MFSYLNAKTVMVFASLLVLSANTQAQQQYGEAAPNSPAVMSLSDQISVPQNEPVPTAIATPETCPDCPPKKAAPKKPDASKAYKALFFDNDFSYLCDEGNCEFYFGDALKNRCLPGGGSYDIGGQYRLRAQFEQNMRGLGLTGVDDQFLLHRTRIYGDFRFSPNIRVYAEMLDAVSNYEDFNPRPIEENRTEIQNLFVDARLLKNGDKSLTARVGRQELLYGAQRAISPLDWANTRRTFEGARLMWKKKDLKLDAFYTQPMRLDASGLDSPDQDKEFMGLYSSYSGKKDRVFDLYALKYANRQGANNFNVTTLGSRWQGSQGSMLWDFEAAYQLGDNTDGSNHDAGMATFGLGKKLGGCWNPTVWAYYDWASGDDATGAGNGFNHNFPLAHKYIGFMDLFGRRNIEDINFQFSVQPSKRLKLLAWYHYLRLENENDTPYSVVMTPFNAANVPGSSELGHEIDLVANYVVTKRQQATIGYSHFFSGNYYDTTAGVPYNGDANFFYSQWSINF